MSIVTYSFLTYLVIGIIVASLRNILIKKLMLDMAEKGHDAYGVDEVLENKIHQELNRTKMRRLGAKVVNFVIFGFVALSWPFQLWIISITLKKSKEIQKEQNCE